MIGKANPDLELDKAKVNKMNEQSWVSSHKTGLGGVPTAYLIYQLRKHEGVGVEKRGRVVGESDTLVHWFPNCGPESTAGSWPNVWWVT